LSYKTYLLEEIYYCVKHIGFTYSDVMNMSVYERRQYLSHLINENNKKNEAIEEQKEAINNKGARGSRTTKSGAGALRLRAERVGAREGAQR
jgi:hypothetical protein